MRSRILQASHHLGGNHIPGNAHDEQLAKIGIEDQLGWNSRVAASQDCCEWILAFRQIGQSLFANCRKPGLAPKEPLIAVLEPLQRFFGCIDLCVHDRSISLPVLCN